MADQCSGDPVDVDEQGLRIASIFIIMVSSLIGGVSPIVLARQNKIAVPKFAFFICKFVGTGVIITTAFMHLLAPAVDALSDPCLDKYTGGYDWAECIALMTVIVMFFVEMLASRLADDDHDDHGDSGVDPAMEILGSKQKKSDEIRTVDEESAVQSPEPGSEPGFAPGGEAHLAHKGEHKEGDEGGLTTQLLGLFILEFGVLFHSVFIGLTLGTTNELHVLLVVLVFHQMFEGLGLGSRLATTPFPPSKQKWLPYVLAIAFALSTPVGIAAGLGARTNNATTQLLLNGIFDSVSAGILMYTGLVELLAHEFMFNPYMRRAPLKILLLAFACVAFGVLVMALIAKWA